MPKTLGSQAPTTRQRQPDSITYHATLWVDSNFGELSAAVYSVGIAQARREGVIGFGAKLANSETRKALIGGITATAVGMIERRRRLSSPTDAGRTDLLRKAAEVLRLRMGTIAIIATTLAAKLGLSFESEAGEAESGLLQELDRLAAPPGDGEGETGPMPSSAWGSPLQPPESHVFKIQAPIRPTTPYRVNAPAPPPLPLASKRDREDETGWDLAVRRSAGTTALTPQHASAARKRIRAAAAPAFAQALDKAVDATLLQQFAARHPGGVDATKLRAAFADTANRAFAAEFVRLVGGQPPASAADIALGAIIAVAIAQTTARFPIVPPAAVAPMAVLVHRTLRPQLPQLAQMAAVIAAAPAPARATQATHELAW